MNASFSAPASPARRRALGALAAPLLLAACGGGSSSEPAPVIERFDATRTDYRAGERAELALSFRGGAGRIEPEIGPVTSGARVLTPPLSAVRSFRLVVEGPGGRTVRELDVGPGFRDRYITLPQAFAVAEHASVTTADGAVLIIGGSRGESTLSSAIDRFDPATRTFTRIGNLRTGRSGHTATLLADGRVLVLGGASSLQIGNVADLVDPRDGSVAHGGTLVLPRGRHATTLLADGRVLVSGGLERDSAELWDPATNTWRLVAMRMTGPRQHHSATLLADGRVLIAGGNDSGIAELFDPRTERFEAIDAVALAGLQLHAAHRITDGSVLLLGGEAPAGDAWRARAEVLRFDPTTLQFSVLPALSAARTVARSVFLADDRVVLIGGESPLEVPSAGGDSYAPARGGAALAPMRGARAWHSVDRLPDGRLLVVGGHAAGGAFASEVLLYE